MGDKQDIEYIKKLFFDKFGIVLNKIPESNQKRTPDFEFAEKGLIQFVCELKTLECVEPSEETGYKKGDEEGEFWRDGDAAAKKIAHIILDDAHEQLTNYDCPRVLIFLNKNFDIDWQDYVKAIHGYLPFVDQRGRKTKLHWWHRISDGKIKKIKKDIDLYIWIDKVGDGQVRFDLLTDRGRRLAEKYFKLD